MVESARVFPSVAEALGDRNCILATTARDRYLVKRIVTPRQAKTEVRSFIGEGEASGILFGPERMGCCVADGHRRAGGNLIHFGARQ